jgi:hypothetical protein
MHALLLLAERGNPIPFFPENRDAASPGNGNRLLLVQLSGATGMRKASEKLREGHGPLDACTMRNRIDSRGWLDVWKTARVNAFLFAFRRPRH